MLFDIKNMTYDILLKNNTNNDFFMSKKFIVEILMKKHIFRGKVLCFSISKNYIKIEITA